MQCICYLHLALFMCIPLDGKFIKEIKLPTRSNYQLIEELDSKYFVTWTLPGF